MDENFYRSIMKEQPVGYAYLKIVRNEEGIPCDYEFLDTNTALENLKGLQGVAIGKRLSHILAENSDDRIHMMKLYEEIALNGGRRDIELYSLVFQQWYRITAFLKDKEFIVTYFMDKSNEISNFADTQMANRRKFIDILSQEWDRSKRKGNVLSVIILDIDQFKKYNDFYGHLQGDQCLYTIAQALITVVKRPADLVARWGDDEFVCILPETDLRGASLIGEHIRKAVYDLAIPNAMSTNDQVTTVSVGVATMIPTNSNSYEDLLKLADKALNSAKEKGRNRVVSE